MRRHVIALVGAAGLMLFVAAGTWVLLHGASSDVGLTGIALAGGAVAVSATVARGSESRRRLRILLGSIGLFVAVVALALAVIAFAIGSDARLAFVVAVVATVGYIQGAAAQARLGFRVVLPWILLGLAVGIPTGVLGLGFSVALKALDLDDLGYVIATAVAGILLRAWSSGRPDRLAAPAAVARTAAGRPNREDRVIIERGPLALLRSSAPIR